MAKNLESTNDVIFEKNNEQNKIESTETIESNIKETKLESSDNILICKSLDQETNIKAIEIINDFLKIHEDDLIQMAIKCTMENGF